MVESNGSCQDQCPSELNVLYLVSSFISQGGKVGWTSHIWEKIPKYVCLVYFVNMPSLDEAVSRSGGVPSEMPTLANSIFATSSRQVKNLRQGSDTVEEQHATGKPPSC